MKRIKMTLGTARLLGLLPGSSKEQNPHDKVGAELVEVVAGPEQVSLDLN